MASKGGGYGGLGAPPPDHPRRCQARSRKNPAGLCPHWALRGYSYCRLHLKGRDRKQWERDKKLGVNGHTGISSRVRGMVHTYFGQVLGTRLSQALEHAARSSDPDLWGVAQELGVARGSMSTLIMRANRLQNQYDALIAVQQKLMEAGLSEHEALEAMDEDARKLLDSTERQLILVNAAIRQGMEDCAKIAERGHKMMSATAVTLTTDQVQALINQMVRILDQVCQRHGDVGRKIALQFEEEFRTTVNLPKARGETVGTLITPDKAALMMDQTISALPNEVYDHETGQSLQ